MAPQRSTDRPEVGTAPRRRMPRPPRQLRLLELPPGPGPGDVHAIPATALPGDEPPAPGHRRSGPARRAAGRRATRAGRWVLDPATRELGRQRVAETKELVARLLARAADDGERRCA